jgi:3-oxoacyl-[acyl-carrier protein] reductase
MTEPAQKTTANELSGRVAVVTGSARNIGRAIALALSAAGASVTINARSSRDAAQAVVEEIERAGGKALLSMADVTDPAAVAALVEATVARFGRLDIMVNNAAVRDEAPFEEMAFEDWKRTVGVILDGAFLCSQASVPAMRRAGGGSIINIGGLTAHIGARQRAHVVTAKAGIVGLTKALAIDLAPHGITVNCVSPGLIDTKRFNKPDPAHRAERKTVVGRLGKPEEVAAMVRMLCGPDARYITGQTLHVNGGVYMP